jgi:hypothetical protein
MYNKDGNLVPIEINTNVGLHYNLVDVQPFDLTDLSQFITNNGFTKINYIGNISKFDKKLQELTTELGIIYEKIAISQNSVTIPYIEDNDTTLIIRSAYDTTALVDDTYCRDKVNFLNLISNTSFNSQFAYKDIDNNLINNITTINDSGNHPNFILKSVSPNYDKNEYPKLYKVTTQEELDIVLSNVDREHFLMEFHFNTNNIQDNHFKVIRGLNLLFPPNLESLSIGGYSYLTPLDITSESVYDSETFEISVEDRNKYITNDTPIGQPKLLDTDKVEMMDGTFKTALELQVGDLVKTIEIPNPDNVDFNDESANFNITFEQFSAGGTFSSNEVLSKKRVSKLVNYVRIDFTDGTYWEDTQTSIYLALRNNSVRFLGLNYEETDPFENNVQIGDEIILIDTTNSEFTPVLKEIQTITNTKTIFTGWEIGIDRRHMFLTQTIDNTSFVAIEHNLGCADDSLQCTRAQCGKTQYCTRGNGTPCANGQCACRAYCFGKV